MTLFESNMDVEQETLGLYPQDTLDLSAMTTADIGPVFWDFSPKAVDMIKVDFKMKHPLGDGYELGGYRLEDDRRINEVTITVSADGAVRTYVKGSIPREPRGREYWYWDEEYTNIILPEWMLDKARYLASRHRRGV